MNPAPSHLHVALNGLNTRFAVGLRICLATCLLALLGVSSTHAQVQTDATTTAPTGGPIRLRQPAVESLSTLTQGQSQTAARPGEFETFVKLPRFGTDMVNELSLGATDFSPVVPPDYIVQSGDELQVTLWGSVDADLRLTVDRSGRVTIPRVGPVTVAGLRFVALQDTLTRSVGHVFKGFELSVALGRLRGVRVYVTGFVQRPGAYVVSSLSTAMNTVMRAGGPAASGSFRKIELRRGSAVVASLDLYDFLLRGDRSGDKLVQPDDVIHVSPIGPQVALQGSVNTQAVFELKPNETIGDLVRMAGGFNTVADRSRVSVERLDQRNGERVTQFAWPASDSAVLVNGDVVRVFSAVDAGLSILRQTKRIRIDGEVMKPGEYLLPPDSTLSDAMRAAGGPTTAAYLYSTEFTRDSVRIIQQQNYDRALRDFEFQLTRAAGTQRVTNTEDAASLLASKEANARFLDLMHSIKPTGRIVLQLTPQSDSLPDLILEDGDRLRIPPRPNTVGVFGSVYSVGSFLHSAGRTVDDFMRLAGGPTRGADPSSVFVVRANGTVRSSQQDSSYFRRGNQIASLSTDPGDTIFVPEELDKYTWMQGAKDWTLLLYQFGIGISGIKNAIK